MARKRRFEREVGQFRFKLNDPDPKSLRQLIAWKNLQYKRNRLNAFARWKVELLERIHATQTVNFAGMLSTLRVGDKLIAAHMGMRSASVLHYWFPAFDMAYAKFSPGLINLLRDLSRNRGGRNPDVKLGAGNEPYKLLMANANIPVAAGFVGVPSFALRRRELLCESLQRVGRLPIGPFAQWPEN